VPVHCEVIDISLPLTPATPPIPGDPPFSRRPFLTHLQDGCEAAALALSAHAGTHLDFPAHFFPDGKRAGDYPVGHFVLPAVVIDCGQASLLGQDVLAGLAIPVGGAVLFRTRNSADKLFAGPDFPETFAALTPDLAQECIRRQAGLVGLDALSLEPLTDPAYPVHHILLGAGVLILEGLDLLAAPVGRATLCCLPLAMPGAEASPVRAVLLRAGGRPEKD
jgi:arylformamidase